MNVLQSRLKDLLSYDPATGVFTRLKSVCGYGVGSHVGTIDGAGYVSIGIDRRYYRAHRLVWLYVYGRWPIYQIDHINRDKTDNRLVNLREATPSENDCNRGLQANNTSGIKGVVPDKRFRKTPGNLRWRAYISVNGRKRHLGSFPTVEEAQAARITAARSMHGNFACESNR